MYLQEQTAADVRAGDRIRLHQWEASSSLARSRSSTWNGHPAVVLTLEQSLLHPLTGRPYTQTWEVFCDPGDPLWTVHDATP